MKLQQRLALIIGLGAILGYVALEIPHAKYYSQDTLIAAVDTTTMAKESSLVVTGAVERKLGTTRQVDATGEDMVYTRWLVKPDKSLKGTASKPVVVRTMGGQYGFTIVDVEDQPMFEKGESVVLFLSLQPEWRGDYRLVGEFQGKFTLAGTGSDAKAVQAHTNKTLALQDLEQVVKSAQ